MLFLIIISSNLTKTTIYRIKKVTIYWRSLTPGSMLPKVESCISFVENTTGGTALITSLDKAREALQGKTGTLLVK